MELLSLSRQDFPEDHPFHSVRVVPADVRLPPVWLLGSSGASARFAGSLGLGYGFASHFSPTPPGPALDAYREAFQPSEWFERPHVILAVAVVCAETDERADYLARSMDLSWARLQRGELGPLPSPEEATAYEYSPAELFAVAEVPARCSIAGSPETVRARIEALVEQTAADEVMISSMIHDHAARLRSYELVAEALSGTTSHSRQQ